MHPLSPTVKHRGRVAGNCEDIVITMPEVHEAKLAVLICRDAPNRPRLRPAVLFDVDSCIPKWVAIRIDDRPCNYTRLTGIVRHLRACK